MNRYTVCYFITDRNVQDGTTFSSLDWPLHITIAGSFADTTAPQKLAKQLEAIAKQYNAFDVTVESADYLGRHKDVPVHHIAKHVTLTGLHKAVIAQLMQNGVIFRNPDFVNDGYKPHATLQKTEQAIVGSIIHLGQFSLVQHEPNHIPHERIVLKTFVLG